MRRRSPCPHQTRLEKSLARLHAVPTASLHKSLSSPFRFAQYRSSTDRRFRCSHRLVQRIARQHVATINHQTNQSCLECRLRTKVCTPHCPERTRWPALAKMQLRFSRASSDEHLFQLSQQHHRGQHVMRVDRGALCMLGAVSKHPTPLSVSARLADRLPGLTAGTNQSGLPSFLWGN